MTCRPSPTRVAVGFALLLIASTARPAPAQTFTWDNANGTWSTATNWVGGTAPPAGGGATVVLEFFSRAPTGISTTNDHGNPFSVNRLTFEATRYAFGDTIFLDSTSGNTIQMVANGGTNPTIRQQGPGGVFVNSGLTLAAQTEVIGTGSGGVTFGGVLAGGGGLTVNTAPLSTSTGLVFLNNTNTFTGGVTLTAGNLAVGTDGALGTGTLTVNGGTLRPTPPFFVGQVTLANAVTANAALTVIGSSNLTLAGAVSGAGGVNYLGTGTLTLSAANGYSGATSVGGGPLPPGEYGGGTLVLSGPSGSVVASSGFLVGPGATLTLDSSIANNSNRVGNAAGVTVSGGAVNVFGHPTLLTDEAVGTLTAAGNARVNVFAGSAGARLTTPSLARTDRGTFTFDGTNLGGTLAGGSSQIVVSGGVPDLFGGGGAAGTTTISILPYAVGRSPFSGSLTGLVTHVAGTGLRPLAAGEYATTLTSGAATADNVLLAGTATTITAATTVNALVMGGGFFFTTLDGPGTLTVSSGAVAADGFSTVSAGLQFGSREAVFHVGEAFGGLTVSGSIAGSGGLTKSGFGTLTLLGANTYTGTTTVTAGAVGFVDAAAFGADPSAIVVTGARNLSGFTAGLTYIGATPGALGRGLTVTAGTASIVSQGDAGGQPPLLLSGTVTGAGGLSFDIPFTGGPINSIFVLTGANTYTGPTHVRPGVTLIIPSDAALGNGGALDLAGKLSLAGAWTTARPVVLGGQSGFDSELATNGFDVTWDGTVSSAFQFLTFNKTGAGRLTLTAESPFTGAINLAAGELRLGGQGAIRPDSVTVGVGGLLTLDNTATNLTNRLTPATTVNLFGGELRLLGAGGSASTGDLVGTVSAGNGLGVVTVTPGGASARADLVMSGLSAGGVGQAYLFRGDGLGATPGPGVGSLFISGFVPLIGGLGAPGSTTVSVFQAALGDTASTGAGAGFVTYDPATGIRLLTPDEYATAVASGDQTLNNVRLAAGVTVDAPTQVNALHLEAGGGLTLNDTFVLVSGNLFASGGTNAITGAGALRFAEGFITAAPGMVGVAAGSTLTVSAPVEAAGSLTKLGAGTLVLDGTLGAVTNTLTVGTGTLRVGAAPDLSRATLTVLGGATFDLNGNNKIVNGLRGGGDVALGAGTLTVGLPGLRTGGEPLPVATTYAGTITGTGGLSVRAAVGQTNALTLTGATAFTGLTSVGANTRLTLTAAGTVGSSSGVGVGGTLVWDNQIVNITNRLGSGPVTLTGGSLRVTGNFLADSALTTGPLQIGPGTGRLNLSAGPGRTLGLTAASLSRSPGGVVLVSGDRFGETTGTGRANLLFASAPTGLLVGGGGAAGTPQVSILPFALTAFADGGHAFVTYEAANGVRPLTEAEVTPLVVGSVTQNDNVWTVAPTTITAATSVNALVLGHDIDGGATLTVRSGAILVPVTVGGVTVTAPLAFGGAEGVFHDHSFGLTVGGPISGTAGLTKAGPGRLTLTGVNIYAGPTFVADGALAISASVLNGVAGPLGQSSDAVTLAGGTDPFLIFEDDELDFQRPLVVGAGGSGVAYLLGATDGFGFMRLGSSLLSGDVALDGYLTVRATRSDVTRTGFTFGGTISGGGGLIFDTGTIVLGGANTFSGGSTIIETGFPTRPVIGLGTNTALGTGPLVVTGNGTLRPDGGARTLANPVFFPDAFGRVLSTAGANDLTLTGPVVLGTSFGSFETAVTGAGVLTFAGPVAGPFGTTWTVSGGSARLTADSPFLGGLVVLADELRLSGAGALPLAGGITVGLGARLELDNTTTNAARLPAGGFVGPSGGEVAVRGAAGAATAESVFVLTPNSGASGVLTLEPGASGSITFNTVFLAGGSTSMLVRGTNLGAAPGPGVATVFVASPGLVGGGGGLGTPTVGIFQGVLGDPSATGTGAGFVTYDPAVGVRLLTATEYSPVLPAAGTLLVNARLTGVVPGPAVAVGINSLTLAGGASLTLSDTLGLNTGSLFAEGAGATISGGTLAFSTSPGFPQLGVIGVAQGGDLMIGSAIADVSGLHKLGGGLLTLAGAVPATVGDVAVAAGTLRLGAGSQLDNSFVTVYRGATFDLGNNNKAVRGIVGPGTIQLGTGTLTLTQQTASAPFAGTILGGGGVSLVGSVNGATVLELVASSGYTGPTSVDRFSTLRLAGGGTIVSGDLLVAGTVELDNTRQSLGRLSPVSNVILNNGILRFLGGDFTSTSETIGTLTLGQGEAKVQLLPDPDHLVTLFVAGNLVRNPGTTLTVVSQTLGGPIVPGSSRLNVFFAPPLVGGGGAAGTTSISILPYAVRSGFGSTDLVTHEGGGLRALAATEYEPTIPAGVTAANVRLTTTATVSSPATVNALLLAGGGGAVSGAGPLTVASGAIALDPFTGGSIDTPVGFGTREGVVHLPGFSSLTISQPVSGSGGLTVGSTGTLVLSAANTVTGPVRVGPGQLQVNGSLPAAAPVFVTAGGRLSGTGTVTDAVAVAAGSTLAPGNSAGTLTTGPVTVSPSGTYEWEISTAGTGNVAFNSGGSTTGGAEHDGLIVNGNLVLDGAVIRVVPTFPGLGSGFDPAMSFSWRLATATGTISTAGTTIDTSAFFTPGPFQEFSLGTSGNVLYLNFTPIPEPGLVLFATAAGLAGAGFVRRRRRST